MGAVQVRGCRGARACTCAGVPVCGTSTLHARGDVDVNQPMTRTKMRVRVREFQAFRPVHFRQTIRSNLE